jgi:hypothetical protein
MQQVLVHFQVHFACVSTQPGDGCDRVSTVFFLRQPRGAGGAMMVHSQMSCSF